MTPATITTKAPVGPPICTREPPSSEIRNPAITAVTSPWLGEAPLAMPSAMASGSATIATVSPASASRAPAAPISPSRHRVRNFGVKLCGNRPVGRVMAGASSIGVSGSGAACARVYDAPPAAWHPPGTHARGPRLGVVSRTAPHAHSQQPGSAMRTTKITAVLILCAAALLGASAGSAEPGSAAPRAWRRRPRARARSR